MFVGFMAVLFYVSPAVAPTSFELAYLSDGSVMPIAGHRIEDGTFILELRGGGEVKGGGGVSF